MSLDYETGRRVREYLEQFNGEHLTPAAVKVLFRLRDDDMPDVRDLMTEVAILGRQRKHKPRVVTPPAEILDYLVSWLANPAVTSDEARSLLLNCPWCRNHLLYVLDTAPYSDRGHASIRVRLLALPVVHEAHGANGPDRDPPCIRWITP